MKSWKIGAISGLIAGIVAGIVFTFSVKIAVSIGFAEPHWRAILPKAYGVNILLPIIFGVIGGIIYSRVYGVVPGKGVLKGLCFGLILLSIMELRQSTFSISYGYLFDVAQLIFTGFFKWIVYGLVLGFLYEFLLSRYYLIRERPKIIKYNMGSGVLPGAIAGFVGGTTVIIALIISHVIGLFRLPGAPITLTLEFFINQAGAHMFWNIFWGTVFGAMFAKVYNLVPSKGIIKGLYYSLTIFLLNTFQISIYWLGWGLSSSAFFAIYQALWSIFIGFSNAVIFGLVIGYFYKPPK